MYNIMNDSGKIDDATKYLTSLQMFLRQKVDIELVNTSAKFGDVRIQINPPVLGIEGPKYSIKSFFNF